jgi:hypothetical protein
MEISTLITVLLVLGILIIIVSLAVFFVPVLKPLLEGRQRFKGFGLELEINTVALLLLFGIALTLPGFYFYIEDFQNQLDKAQSEIDLTTAEWKEKFRRLEYENEGLKEKMEGGTKYDINAILQFRPTEAPSFGSIKNLECSYTTWKGGDPVIIKATDVQPGPSEGSIEARIKGLDRDDFVLNISVRNRLDNTVWHYDKPFKPAKPSFEMTKKMP